MSHDSCRSWFLVLNNPSESIGNLSPQQMCDRICDMWVSNSPTRSCACLYCISALGLHHLHIVCEDSNKARFSALKSAFPRAHIEATRGNKKQVLDYIKKQGAFSEQGEEIVYMSQIGEIQGHQGRRSDLDEIEKFLESGLKPSEIMSKKLSYRKYEKMIKDAYFDIRKKSIPLVRDINVVWHVGESGTGKTYSYIKACEKFGDDDVYLISDYDSGGLDRYCGERCLFLDEFRGQIRFSTLLAMLQGYKQQFHARYTNVYGLWEEVHIATVLPPELVYKNMVSDNHNIDTLSQLYRRITTIEYHYKENGCFKVYSIPFEQYKGYSSLCVFNSEFVLLENEQLELPFD